MDSSDVPASVSAMLDNKATTPTAPLEDFVKAYEQDDNWWWRIVCGHHQNLFDSAIERIRELELVILSTADQVMEAIKETEDLAALAGTELDLTEEAINERWPEERKDDHE